ncbi:hypothetical protein CRG98_006202 [Punica granatum]|uniref:Uncharacterized protein n=1 Tax=Punica granatum TaxID=22663 RepID=A0A2I0KY91_PUNGR|nr:hypothetical protein CRG98_006202 [Punica granatum]
MSFLPQRLRRVVPTSFDWPPTTLSLPSDKEVTGQEPFHRAQPLPGRHHLPGFHLLSFRFPSCVGLCRDQQLECHLQPCLGVLQQPWATVHSPQQPHLVTRPPGSSRLNGVTRPPLLFHRATKLSFTPRGVGITFSRLRGARTFSFRALGGAIRMDSGHGDHRPHNGSRALDHLWPSLLGP